jgi:malonyl CoA-acyl carrier protein transacylase
MTKAKERLAEVLATTAECVAEIVSGVEDVWIANVNSSRQTMLLGTREGIAPAAQRLATADVETSSIPVGCDFHSPLMAGSQARLAAVFATPFSVQQVPVFRNTTAPYPQDPSGASAPRRPSGPPGPISRRGRIDIWVRVRTFVDVGPAAVLTGLVGQGWEHLAVATGNGSSSLAQLQHTLARLLLERIPLSLDRLIRGPL